MRAFIIATVNNMSIDLAKPCSTNHLAASLPPQKYCIKVPLRSN